MFAWVVGFFRWLLSLFTRKRQPADPMVSGFPPGIQGLSPGLLPGSGPYSPPRDPFSGVRHPRTLRPGGKTAAVAVEEPEEDERLMAVGRMGP